MKAGKGKDTSSVVAELLKASGDDFREITLGVFNDFLEPDALPPRTWTQTWLVVIYKKGDRKCPGNYRPIAIMPVMYKLFS